LPTLNNLGAITQLGHHRLRYLRLARGADTINCQFKGLPNGRFKATRRSGNFIRMDSNPLRENAIETLGLVEKSLLTALSNIVNELYRSSGCD
tara:strand:+ start:280 stop:558 length:279 start_codon:yes stop_codon:yes gene_type:complete